MPPPGVAALAARVSALLWRKRLPSPSPLMPLYSPFKMSCPYVRPLFGMLGVLFRGRLAAEVARDAPARPLYLPLALGVGDRAGRVHDALKQGDALLQDRDALVMAILGVGDGADRQHDFDHTQLPSSSMCGPAGGRSKAQWWRRKLPAQNKMSKKTRPLWSGGPRRKMRFLCRSRGQSWGLGRPDSDDPEAVARLEEARAFGFIVPIQFYAGRFGGAFRCLWARPSGSRRGAGSRIAPRSGLSPRGAPCRRGSRASRGGPRRRRGRGRLSPSCARRGAG